MRDKIASFRDLSLIILAIVASIWLISWAYEQGKETYQSVYNSGYERGLQECEIK